MNEPNRTTWGSNETQFFFSLTPDKVFDCLEVCLKASGIPMIPTGRVSALNSFENRVYEVEFEKEDDSPFPQSHPMYRRILKFYRPGRWSKEQILEEHEFLKDLTDAEIPVIAPEILKNGETLLTTPEGIFYTLFPKRGGRSPDELDLENSLQVGRLVARIHAVGRKRIPKHRVTLNAETYARHSLEYLRKGQFIPAEFEHEYSKVVEKIADFADEVLDPALYQRIHGDCHFGNLLSGREGFFYLDFDDFCFGPPVQDLWLMQSSRESESLNLMLEGYEEILTFNRSTLKWIEILRALRFVHYSGWIARRYDDPAFPKAFPHFGSRDYWREELSDLEKQWQLMKDCRKVF